MKGRSEGDGENGSTSISSSAIRCCFEYFFQVMNSIRKEGDGWGGACRKRTGQAGDKAEGGAGTTSLELMALLFSQTGGIGEIT